MIRSKGTPIELDKTRYLRYTAEAMEDFEDEMGFGVMHLIEQAGNEVTKFTEIKPIRSLLQAGLKEDDPQISDKKTGKKLTSKMIDAWIAGGKSIPELYTTVLGAVRKDQWPTMTNSEESAGDGEGE